MTSWLSRAWSFVRSMPLILVGIAVAVAAVMSARRSMLKAKREIRLAPDVGGMTPTERASAINDQIEQIRRAKNHIDAAAMARQRALDAASRIETAGHPSVAELVRSWNRE